MDYVREYPRIGRQSIIMYFPFEETILWGLPFSLIIIIIIIITAINIIMVIIIALVLYLLTNMQKLYFLTFLCHCDKMK